TSVARQTSISDLLRLVVVRRPSLLQPRRALPPDDGTLTHTNADRNARNNATLLSTTRSVKQVCLFSNRSRLVAFLPETNQTAMELDLRAPCVSELWIYGYQLGVWRALLEGPHTNCHRTVHALPSASIPPTACASSHWQASRSRS